MMNEQPRLELEVAVMVGSQLCMNECIDRWGFLPTNDLVVFLIDRELQTAIAPFIEKAGPPRLGSGRTLVFARDRGRWEQVGFGGWGLGVDQLRRTFRIAANEQPSAGWERGFRICLRWSELANCEVIRQHEVNELLAELHAESVPSPLWREAWRQLAAWTRNRGFVVPEASEAEPGAAADRPRE